MMLLILSADPVEAAKLIPKKIRHKQLLEIMQMISCVVEFGYIPLSNGKRLKEWILEHAAWMYIFTKRLVDDMKYPNEETKIKYRCLLDLLRLKDRTPIVPNIKTAIFRYAKEYKGNTIYKTDEELPIDEAIEEYKKYLEWKGDKWQ